MKRFVSTWPAWFILGLLWYGGCTMTNVQQETTPAPADDIPRVSYPAFVPVKVGIIPLTQYVVSSNPDNSSYLKVYVELLDNYNSQMKAPGTFRFELYDRVSRSVEPKGQRIRVWQDIVLTDLDENNRYWREFLRSYEFRLDYTPQDRTNCVLEVTFITPEGKRLTAQINLSLETTTP